MAASLKRKTTTKRLKFGTSGVGEVVSGVEAWPFRFGKRIGFLIQDVVRSRAEAPDSGGRGVMEDLVLAAGYASAALEKLLRHGEVSYCGSPEEEMRVLTMR